jgi:hypothetical protein
MLAAFASVPIRLLNSAELIAAGETPLPKVPRSFVFSRFLGSQPDQLSKAWQVIPVVLNVQLCLGKITTFD